MYIPNHYKQSDKKQIAQFINEYPFGLIVGNKDGRPIGTHLPFVLNDTGENWTLSSHLAKVNPHAEILEQQELLCIFSEPHAYISPKHYEKKQNVPTWNYVSVHCYGTATIVSEEKQVFRLLEEMILQSEESYIKQWQELDDNYKKKMAAGITAFNFEITEIQAKEKLSQNKKEAERKNIIKTLSESNKSVENEIGRRMVGK